MDLHIKHSDAYLVITGKIGFIDNNMRFTEDGIFFFVLFNAKNIFYIDFFYNNSCF